MHGLESSVVLKSQPEGNEWLNHWKGEVVRLNGPSRLPIVVVGAGSHCCAVSYVFRGHPGARIAGRIGGIGTALNSHLL
ncbi:uncharacterized protein N7484_008697 [Penicillium longicatenatum]|uniref:uncharacterized protein n=1 Tax=Penicillium longicatenatum TaxID=1561947 RepID=UPI0025485749|nr:uncharacterized protein N7484_008697 [Penicillium longicatenatum]KAJ5635384.1 hypothetical protein N7484_008697 [Penicillium longicatenatum]